MQNVLDGTIVDLYMVPETWNDKVLSVTNRLQFTCFAKEK